MQNLYTNHITDTIEERTLEAFRLENVELFEKNDFKLFLHLGLVLSMLGISTAVVLTAPFLWIKILLGTLNALLWFALVNVTLHHHHTHHNAARHPFADRLLDGLYFLVVPNAPKRLGRYTRAHLNHHARPFHETDIDHHYGTERYLEMMKSFWSRIFYFLELTFIGGHVPGWEDDHYMNQVPLEEWNRKDYEKVKIIERRKARAAALLQWSLFGLLVWLFPPLAWGWTFPMLLVKNWAHFLGQFQHYDEQLLDPSRSVLNRTKTYRFPSWLNYLAAGEISGHFIHHLFPELPYYHVEEARRRFVNYPELSNHFVTYSRKHI